MDYMHSTCYTYMMSGMYDQFIFLQNTGKIYLIMRRDILCWNKTCVTRRERKSLWRRAVVVTVILFITH